MGKIKVLFAIFVISCLLWNCKPNIKVGNKGNFKKYYEKYEPNSNAQASNYQE